MKDLDPKTQSIVDDINIYKAGYTPEQVDAGLTADQLAGTDEADNYAYANPASLGANNSIVVPATESVEPAQSAGVNPWLESAKIEGVGSYSNIDDAVSLDEATRLIQNYDADRIKRAKEMAGVLGLPEALILHDYETFNKAEEMTSLVARRNIPTQAELEKYYPKISELANRDVASAALALKQMENVKVAHGIIENVMAGLRDDSVRSKRSAIGMKAFFGDGFKESDWEDIAKLDKQAEDEKEVATIYDSFLDAMAGGIASNGKMMLRQSMNATTAGLMGVGAVLGMALSTKGTTALPAGALGGSSMAGSALSNVSMGSAALGAGAGLKAGMITSMFKEVVGDKYIEFKNYRDARGESVLDDSSARLYAALSAGLETGIEFYNIDSWVGLLGGNKKNEAALSLIKNMIANTKDATSFKMLASALAEKLKNGSKVAWEEVEEEMAQEASGMLITNAASAEDASGVIPTYTAGDITTQSLEAGLVALPASVGFAAVGSGASMIKGVRNVANVMRGAQNEISKQKANNRIITTLETLAESPEVQEFIKENPQAAETIIDGQLAEQGIDKAYIDTELLLEDEGGIEVFNQLAADLGYTEEQAESLRMQGGELVLPSYKMLTFSPEAREKLREYVSFDEATACFKRNKEYMQKAAAKEIARATKSVEQVSNSVMALAEEAFPGDEEKSFMAYDIVMNNLNVTPAEAFKIERNKYEAELDAIIGPTLEMLKEGMGHGVSIVLGGSEKTGFDESRGIRVSNNDLWYQKFYKNNGRRPNKQEMREIAIVNMTVRPTEYLLDAYAGLENMELESPDEWQKILDLRERIDGLTQMLGVLDSVKDGVTSMTLDEVNAGAELSSDAMELYKSVVKAARNAGNKKTQQTAMMNALLLAYHADAAVDLMRRSGGEYRNYTIADWFKANPVAYEFGEGQGSKWSSAKMYGVNPSVRVMPGAQGRFDMPLRDSDREIIPVNGKEEIAFIEKGVQADGVNVVAAPISLYVGYQVVNSDTQEPIAGMGLAHLAYKHSEYLEKFGYKANNNAMFGDLINDVLASYDGAYVEKIRAGEVNDIILHKTLTDKSGVALVLGYDEQLSCYSIKTISPMKKKQVSKLENRYKKIDLSLSGHPADQTQQPAAAPLSNPAQNKAGTARRPLMDKRNDKSISEYSLSDIQEKVKAHTIFKTTAEIKEDRRAQEEFNQLAYHGTPHVFDKFDLGYLGTGEGAQVHGWGLYFAADKKVSEEYRRRLAEDVVETYKGKELVDFYMELERKGDYEKAEVVGQWLIDHDTSNITEEYHGKRNIKWFKEKVEPFIKQEGSGAVMEVEIPDDDVLLNTETSIKEQPKEVQAGLLKVITSLTDKQKETFVNSLLRKSAIAYVEKATKDEEVIKEDRSTQNRVASALRKLAGLTKFKSKAFRFKYDDEMTLLESGFTEEDIAAMQADQELAKEKALAYIEPLEQAENEEQAKIAALENKREQIKNEYIASAAKSFKEGKNILFEDGINGADVYGSLSVVFGNDKETSLYLNKHGIKGLSYDSDVDGRCFVVFDDKAVSIIEQYNQAAGEHAETANLEALAKAQEMAKEGKDRGEIFDATGWYLQKDGRWRFEIPDNLDKINLSVFSRKIKIDDYEYDKSSAYLSEFYDNPALYEAYPRLKFLRVQLENVGENLYGYADGEHIGIDKDLLKDDPNQAKLTLVHELQHIIQGIEGFASGGNPYGVRDQIVRQINITFDKLYKIHPKIARYNELAKELEDAMLFGDISQEEMDVSRRKIDELNIPEEKRIEAGKLRGKLDSLKETLRKMDDANFSYDAKLDAYKNLHGEIEARQASSKAELYTAIANKDMVNTEEERNAINQEREEYINNLEPEIQNLARAYVTHKDDGRIDLSYLNVLRTLREKGMDVLEKLHEYDSKITDTLLEDGTLERERLYNDIMSGDYDYRNAIVVFNGQEVAGYNTSASPMAKGSTFITNGVRTIKLFQAADQSTFLHEAAHLFFDDLERMYNMPGVNNQVRKDWVNLNKWASWNDNSMIEYKGTAVEKEFSMLDMALRKAKMTGTAELGGREYTFNQLERRWKQERFARGFEEYMKGGKAPTGTLRAMFHKFSEWLKSIYSHFRAVGAEPTAEVKEIMDRMLATQDALDEAFDKNEYDELKNSGALNYLAHSEQVMWAKIVEEARVAVHEKVLKIAMKDLRKADVEARQKQLDEAREDITVRLSRVPAFMVQKIIANNKEITISNAMDAVGVTNNDYKAQVKEYGPTLETAVERYMANYEKQLRKDNMEKLSLKERAEEALATTHYAELIAGFELVAIKRRIQREQNLSRKLAKLTGDDAKARKEAIVKAARNMVLKDAIRDVKEELKKKKDLARKLDEKHLNDILSQHPVYRAVKLLEENKNMSEAEALEITGIDAEYYADTLTKLGPTLRAAVEKIVKDSEKVGKEYGVDGKLTEAQIRALAEERMQEEEYQKRIMTYEEELASAPIKTEIDKVIENLDKHRKEKAFVERGVRMMRDATKGQVEAIRKAAIKKMNSLSLQSTANPLVWQRKAAEENEKALASLAKKDFVQGAKHKQLQLAYNIMADEAYRRKNALDKLDALYKARSERLRTSTDLAAEERYLYGHMLYVLGYVNKDFPLPQEAGYANPREVFDKFIANNRELLKDIYIDEENGGYLLDTKLIDAIYGNSQIKLGLKDFTLDGLKEVKNLMATIYKLGREHGSLKVLKDEDGKVLELERTIGDMLMELDFRHDVLTKDETGAQTQTTLEKALELGDEAFQTTVKPETILYLAGPTFERLIYTPVKRALDKKERYMQELVNMQKKIWDDYAREKATLTGNKDVLGSDFFSKKQYVLGTSRLTHENIIVLALNFGTELNRKRILDGYGVMPKDIYKVLGNLDEADWKLVENIWGLFDKYWPELEATQERTTGVVMEKQSAIPLQVYGKNGKVYKVAGGYYPIKYNANYDVNLTQLEQNETARMGSSDFNSRSGMRMGSTKARVDGKVNKKILLDLQAMNKTLEDTVQIITMKETLRDVNIILNNDRIKDGMRSRLGNAATVEAQRWLADAWASEPAHQQVYERLLKYFRQNSTVAALAFNANVAMLNLTNIFPMAHYLGVARTLKAIKEFYTHPQEKYAFAYAKSTFLQTRESTVDVNVTGRKKGAGRGKAGDFINEAGFWMAGVTDKMFMIPLWSEEYQRAYQELVHENVLALEEDKERQAKMQETDMDEERYERIHPRKYKHRTAEEIDNAAVDAGDKSVRKVFGSARTIDLAGVQRSKSEAVKMLTMFYSYFSIMHNALVEAYGDSKINRRKSKYYHKDGEKRFMEDMLPLMSAIIFWYMLPAVGEVLIRDLASGDDDKGMEKYINEFISTLFGSLVGGLPIIREGVPALLSAVTGTDYFRPRASAAVEEFDQLRRIITTAQNDKKDKADVARAALRALNPVIGIPKTLADGFVSTVDFLDHGELTKEEIKHYLWSVTFAKDFDKNK